MLTTLLALAAVPMAAPQWRLTFSDEFRGTRLDSTKWIDSYPYGVRTHSNNEQQYYAPDAVEVRDGKLWLRAERRSMGGMPYTSGMVTTFGKFAQTYGRFEIRAKFPAGKGFWPAFWLLPNSTAWPPEIDVLEILGHETNTVYMTNHWKDAQGKHQSKGDKFVGPDFAKGFHTYAVDWLPDSITWYVDGKERFRVTKNIPNEPFYVLANLAIGGDWPGNPDATTPFPAYAEIDYVRVYRRA